MMISIRYKLAFVVILGIITGSFMNTVYIGMRTEEVSKVAFQEKALLITEYAAFNSTPAVLFNDSTVLTEALQGLTKSRDFHYAFVITKDGTTLASIKQDASPYHDKYPKPQQAQANWEHEFLHVIVPITDKGEILGHLFLGLNLTEPNRQISRDLYLAILFNIISGSLVTLLVLLTLQHLIIKPIRYLNLGIKEVGEGNFQIAQWTKKVKNNDELGMLAVTFNEMTRTVREKTDEIVHQNQKLIDREKRLETAVKYLSTFLPNQFVDKVLNDSQNQSNLTSPQREKLTVFFSDLQGFTSLADQLDPETLFQVLNQYQNVMTHIVTKYDGTLDKYMGDGLMVFFGAPYSRGNKEDTLRCCLMAMEMQEAMKDVRNTWYNQGIESPLSLRIGIHTGFGIVGSFGTELRLDYTAIGQAVNIASRLEHACPAGGVLISHQAWANIYKYIHTIEGESITPKGLLRPMKTYLLGGIMTDLIDPSRNAGLTPELRAVVQHLPKEWISIPG